MQPSEAYVEANGLRLHYLTWGDAASPTLVMTHANGFLARLWQPVAEKLAARYHVYAYDTRGHGDSDKPDPAGAGVDGRSNYDWERFADDLRAFLDALQLRGVAVVGHSSGGAAAAWLAAHHPEYFSRLVLIEPIIIPAGVPDSPEQRQRMSDGARKRRQVWDSREELMATYRQRPTFARWADDALGLYAEHGMFQREDGQFQLKCPGAVEASIFEHSGKLPVSDVLPQVACPTLVMRGQLTEMFTSYAAQAAAERIPGARLVTVPNAGHLAPMEQPDAVAGEIMSFLSEGG